MLCDDAVDVDPGHELALRITALIRRYAKPDFIAGVAYDILAFPDPAAGDYLRHSREMTLLCSRKLTQHHYKLELKHQRHVPVAQIGEWLRKVVVGYYRYHAVPGNISRLEIFRHRLRRL